MAGGKGSPRSGEAPRAGASAAGPAPEPRAIVNLASLLREEANRFISEKLAARGIEGIMPPHGQVLVPLLAAGGTMSLGEIAAAGGRAKSTITGMVATLEKYGYITRRQSEEDGRSYLAELTPKGESLGPAFAEISRELQELVYRGIEEKDRLIAVSVLDRAVKNLSLPAR